jgi:hypothetical protein
MGELLDRIEVLAVTDETSAGTETEGEESCRFT